MRACTCEIFFVILHGFLRDAHIYPSENVLPRTRVPRPQHAPQRFNRGTYIANQKLKQNNIMSQNPTSYSSKESDIASKNLWIGELEQWMDSNYLIDACHSYSKFNIS